MKIRFLRSVSALLCGVCLLIPAHSRADSITVGANATVTLPAGWKAVEQSTKAPVTASGSAPHLDPTSYSLLLLARPDSPSPRTTLSLFRFDAQQGSTDTVQDTDRVAQAALSLGFSPTGIRTRTVDTTGGNKVKVIEIKARHHSGEERTFVGGNLGGSPPVYFSASWRASDILSSGEVDRLIASSGVTGGDMTATTPSTVQNPENAGAPAKAPTISELVNAHEGALMMVEGEKGAGSGFLCTVEGRTFAVTNAHVLCGNPQFRLTTLGGSLIAGGPAGIAVGHDIVRMEARETGKPFEVMVDCEKNVKIGDAVSVLGNAEGARVVKPVEGKVLGIGPDLVEVDAPFVPGNSGSPIIHQRTGKVLGVATYLVKRRVKKDDSNKVTVETRRFGFRLDSVKTWEPIQWARFHAQADQIGRIEELSQDFIRLSNNSGEEDLLDPSKYQTTSLRRVLQTFLDAVRQSGRTMSEADRKNLVRRFLADLRSVTRGDLTSFQSRSSYDYFRRRAGEQSAFRDELYTSFSRVMESRRD